MTPKQIFDDYLVLGKKITLEFPSQEEVTKFISHLRTLKYRAENYSARFGFTAGTEELSIITTSRSSQNLEGGVILTVKLDKRAVPTPTYKILEILEIEEESPDATLPANLGKDQER